MISAHRYAKLMQAYQQTHNLSESARQAGVDRKTARTYVQSGQNPKQLQVAHTWRTREDPFKDVWEQIEGWLEVEPYLQATSILEELQIRFPEGGFDPSHLRTLQRRVKAWRLENAHPKSSPVYFEQVHEPGRALQLDWFHPKSFEVTVAGEVFSHLICHTVLTYSNWEHANICKSESSLSLKTTLQEALWQLGGSPEVLQTDNSSTATHSLGRKGKKRAFNESYLALTNYYGLRPRTINIGAAHENGDVESAHHQLRRAITDSLALRGSSEFESVEAYQHWLNQLVERRNLNRQSKVAEEKLRLKPLPEHRLPEYQELPCRVNKYGLVRVGKSTYSLPACARGKTTLRARLYERCIEIWDEQSCVVRFEEVRPLRGEVWIDWRHLILDLCRKPGAFERFRWKQWFFPSGVWHEVYQWLCRHYSERRANTDYVHLLALALEEGLERLEVLLRQRLDSEELNLDVVRQDLGQQKRFRHLGQQLLELEPDLRPYDELISSEEVKQPNNEEEVHHG